MSKVGIIVAMEEELKQILNIANDIEEKEETMKAKKQQDKAQDKCSNT